MRKPPMATKSQKSLRPKSSSTNPAMISAIATPMETPSNPYEQRWPKVETLESVLCEVPRQQGYGAATQPPFWIFTMIMSFTVRPSWLVGE